MVGRGLSLNEVGHFGKTPNSGLVSEISVVRRSIPLAALASKFVSVPANTNYYGCCN